jgi:hypothetical protein
MEFAMHHRIVALIIPAVVSACAASVDAPSLAIRPGETTSAIDAARPVPVAPPAPPAVVALDGATVTRIDASLRAARASVAPFARAAEPARAAVAGASGAAAGSEAWIAAQLAISRLERAREGAANALAEVDSTRRLLVVGGSNFDRAALATVQDEIARINAAQQDEIRALIARLKRR